MLDADELSGVSEDKRLTLSACLVHTARIRARDEVVTMFCKRMATITQKAREKLEELREQHRTESERLLGVFGDVLAGVREALGPTETEQGGDGDNPPDGDGEWARSRGAEPIGVVAERTGRILLKTLHEAGGVVELSAAHEAVSAHHGNNYTPLMERFYRSHRAMLFRLAGSDRAGVDQYRPQCVGCVGGAAGQPRSGRGIHPRSPRGARDRLVLRERAWRTTLRDRRRPGRVRRRHFEVCVFAHLAAELGTGDIAVTGAESYANLHTQLMYWSECEPLVGEYCAQAGLPDTATGCVAAWQSGRYP